MDGLTSHTPLRILMTSDTVGGVWSYSMALCRALSPYGVQFFLVTTGAPMQPAQQHEAESLGNVTVYETDYLLEWMDNPWQSIDASGGWLLQLEQALQPDCIHLNGYAYGSLPWKAPVIVVAHSDVWSWWLAVKKTTPPGGWNEYFNRVKAGLHQANYIVAPSAAMLEAFTAIYASPVPATVIYNGSSAETFHPACKDPYIFSMGRIWDEAKNIRLLADAAPFIRYPIRLAGDQAFAGNKGVAAGTNITWLGKLDHPQVAAQLSAASVYVLPARYEPFGLSVLEAALSGCALVLGNIGSLREIWGDSAIYVDNDNAYALAATVNLLMQDEEQRMRYAQKALAHAAAYTTTAMAAKYLQVYRRLLQPENIYVKEIL